MVGRRGRAPRRVVVLGAGRMGADIALAFARAGWQCEAVEPDEAARARAAAYWPAELARMRARSACRRLRCRERMQDVDWSTVDLAVEAVPEDLALKHEVLRAVETLAPAGALIATNTSSLRIADVTRVLRRRGRGAGLHFSVPAHIMAVVEITKGEHSDQATADTFADWVRDMGKVPVLLNRDIPGMLINRIQHAMYREIYHLVDSGVASVQDIDRAVRFGFGFRYQILGPLISRDIHGLPVHLATARELYPTLCNGTQPGELLTRLVDEGCHGVATGRGFYEWDRRSTPKRLAAFAGLLERALRRVRRMGEPAEF